MDIKKYDVIIVGAGPSGAIIANRYANKGKNVLILEKRNHVAGNLYDKKNSKGILYHVFGPHIFHTNDDQVIDYVTKLAPFHKYRWKVNVNINNKEVPLPINFKSIDMLFDKKKAEAIKKALTKQYPKTKVAYIMDMRQSKDPLVQEMAEFVYKNVFENYTVKMWGITPQQIDIEVLKRVPVRLSYDDGYFDDKFQGVPKQGYTELISKILKHKNITIKKNVKADKLIKVKNNKIYFEGKELKQTLVWTGPIDELFANKFGALPYRSLNFTFKTLNQKEFQSRGTVNYPADPKMTRITEYKKVTLQKNDKYTTIGKEFPGQFDPKSKWNDRYYPIPKNENKALYAKYQAEANKINNLMIVGRLAEYKYKDMWVAIKDALNKELK